MAVNQLRAPLIKLEESIEDKTDTIQIYKKIWDFYLLKQNVKYSYYEQYQSLILLKMNKVMKQNVNLQDLIFCKEILEVCVSKLQELYKKTFKNDIFKNMEQRIITLLNITQLLIQQYNDVINSEKHSTNLKQKPIQKLSKWTFGIFNSDKTTDDELQKQIKRLKQQINRMNSEINAKTTQHIAQKIDMNDKLRQSQTKFDQLHKKLQKSLERSFELQIDVAKGKQVQRKLQMNNATIASKAYREQRETQANYKKQIKQLQQSLYLKNKIISQTNRTQQDIISTNYTLKIQYEQLFKRMQGLNNEKIQQQATIKSLQIELNKTKEQKQIQIKKLKQICKQKQQILSRQTQSAAKLRKQIMEVTMKNKSYSQQIQFKQKEIEQKQRQIEEKSMKQLMFNDQVKQIRKQNSQLIQQLGTLKKIADQNANNFVYEIQSINERNKFLISKLQHQTELIANNTVQLSRLNKLSEALSLQGKIQKLRSTQLQLYLNKTQSKFQQFERILQKQMSVIEKQKKRQLKTNKNIKHSIIDVNRSISIIKNTQNNLKKQVDQIKQKMRIQQMMIQPQTRYIELMKYFN